jgi:HK97 family phage portal protein
VAGKLEIGNFKMSWGGASKKDVGPTFDLKGSESYTRIFGPSDDFTNETVSERRAHGLSTVYTCINVRSRTIASLPINPMLEEKGVKRIINDHPVYDPLAQQANNYMSSAQMFLTSMIHSDSWGNSIIGINRDSRNKPYSFDLIEPGDWDVTKLEGEAFYKINGEMYTSKDVLHFRWFSLDGLMGISPIRQNQILMGSAFKQARYQGMTLGQRPPGILHYEGTLTPDQRAQNQKSWEKDQSLGKVPILSGKWGYEPIIIPPGEAEYVQTANLTTQEIYGIYQLPPTFAQNYERATWANAEQADLVYAKHTITPICRIIEQECNMKLFTEKEKKNHFVKFNMNGLLRGDITARAAFYTAMRNIGGMNGNEIRDREDMNSYEGGEIFTVQGANVPIDQLKEFYSSKVATSAPNEERPRNGQKLNGRALNHVN